MPPTVDFETPLFKDRPRLTAKACHIAERIDSRALSQQESIVVGKLTPLGGGFAVVFRYGAIVTIEAEPSAVETFRTTILRHATGATGHPETETATILITPEADRASQRRSGFAALGGIPIPVATAGRLLIIAEAVARSAALAFYEERVGEVFERIEPLAQDLERVTRKSRERDLLRLLSDATRTQIHTTGRMDSRDAPELAWDDPQLDRLWRNVREEYELLERDATLTRKLELISSTTSTFYQLVQAHQTHRVEWYILLLILFEVVIIILEMVVASGQAPLPLLTP